MTWLIPIGIGVFMGAVDVLLVSKAGKTARKWIFVAGLTWMFSLWVVLLNACHHHWMCSNEFRQSDVVEWALGLMAVSGIAENLTAYYLWFFKTSDVRAAITWEKLGTAYAIFALSNFGVFCTSTYLLDRGVLWVQGVLGAACNILFFWVITIKDREKQWSSDKDEEGKDTSRWYKAGVFLFSVAYVWTIDYTFENASPLVSASVAGISMTMLLTLPVTALHENDADTRVRALHLFNYTAVTNVIVKPLLLLSIALGFHVPWLTPPVIALLCCGISKLVFTFEYKKVEVAPAEVEMKTRGVLAEGRDAVRDAHGGRNLQHEHYDS